MQKSNCLWIVNQRILPHAGTFAAREVTASEAGEIIHQYRRQRAIVCQVTYHDTRDVLEHLSGVSLPGVRTADRRPIELQPGDAMLFVTRKPGRDRKEPASVRTLDFLLAERVSEPASAAPTDLLGEFRRRILSTSRQQSASGALSELLTWVEGCQPDPDGLPARIYDVLRNWQRARNEASATDLLEIEATYSAQAGLPVLSALYELAQRIEQARGPVMQAELLAELRPVISLALGEAKVRAERRGLQEEIPGVPTIPKGGVL